MTMERLTTGDFIARLPFRSGGARGRGGPWRRAWFRVRARLCCGPAAARLEMLFAPRAAPPPSLAPLGGLTTRPSRLRLAPPGGGPSPPEGLRGQIRPYRGGGCARKLPLAEVLK